MPKQPLQPMYVDDDDRVCFQANKIVRTLLSVGPYDLNTLLTMKFSQEDREQFYQLLGHSAESINGVPYFSRETREEIAEAADRCYDQHQEQQAKTKYPDLPEQLRTIAMAIETILKERGEI